MARRLKNVQFISSGKEEISTQSSAIVPRTQIIEEITNGGLEVNTHARKQLATNLQALLRSVDEAVIIGSIISTSTDEDIKLGIKITEDEPNGHGSLNDPRMGVVERGLNCSICRNTSDKCVGHNGYIPLNQMIYHPHFLSSVIHVLQAICNDCSRILMTDEALRPYMKYSGRKRLEAIAADTAKSRLRCSRGQFDQEEIDKRIDELMIRDKNNSLTREQYIEEYGFNTVRKCRPNPKFKTSSIKETDRVQYESEKDGLQVLDIKVIHERIFAHLLDEDLMKLGFYPEYGSTPKNFIVRNIPVMPTRARYPRFVNGKYEPDYLTKKYTEIIKTNNEWRHTKDEKDKRALGDKIYRLFKELIDKSESSKGTVGQQASIKDLLQGKKGIMRDKLMGARNNYTFRSVIGPDPDLKITQIAIPKMAAPYLTKREYVFQHNIERIKKLLDGGKIRSIIPGPLHGRNEGIIQEVVTGRKYDIKIGDKVDRHLQDGDLNPFNRQPTLHRPGMMAFEVVLKNQLNIGVPLGVTPAYNAD